MSFLNRGILFLVYLEQIELVVSEYDRQIDQRKIIKWERIDINTP